MRMCSPQGEFSFYPKFTPTARMSNIRHVHRMRSRAVFNGGPSGIRTLDALIKSQVSNVLEIHSSPDNPVYSGF